MGSYRCTTACPPFGLPAASQFLALTGPACGKSVRVRATASSGTVKTTSVKDHGPALFQSYWLTGNQPPVVNGKRLGGCMSDALMDFFGISNGCRWVFT